MKKTAVITRDPPKIILAFMFVLFALMIWIATVQFLKNDQLYQDSVRKEEMLAAIVDMYSNAIHSPEAPQLLSNGDLGKDIYLFRLDPEGNLISGSLGVLTSTRGQEGNPQLQIIMLAETNGYGFIAYETHSGKRIAYIRMDPKTSNVVGGSMRF